MLNRRFAPYLITAGMLALLVASYLGYREYQNYVVHEEFMSQALAFQRTLDKDTTPDTDSVDRQTTQQEGNAASPARAVVSNQTGRSNNQEDSSSTPVKVQMLTPEQVAKYSDGDPNGSVAIKGNPLPDGPDRSWGRDELVTQLVELPDGTVVEILSTPGLELQEGDRVSPQFIANNMSDRITHVEMEDGTKYDVPIGVAPDEFIDKVAWAHHLGISVEEADRMIANRELIVKSEGESMTNEEEGIMAKLLNKIPKFASFLQSERPDLLDAEPAPDNMHQQSPKSGGGELEGADSSSAPFPLIPAESESIPQDTIKRQVPVPSEPPTASNPKMESRDGLSPERFDKAQQLIDQYGAEEGLRRLREIDPDAARQFERTQREQKMNTEP